MPGSEARLCCCAAALLAWLALADAQAQEFRSAGSASAPAQRELMIGGQPSPEPKLQRCIEVMIGSDREFGCLNQQLKREVDQVNPLFNVAPIDARSPDVRVGNVNEAALRQQYGSNFGRSAYPFRPPRPVFSNPRR